MRYTFEWDPKKARENLRKHRIGFENAMEIFLDPLAITIADEEHSVDEQRWVTVGRDSRQRILVLIHTFSELSAEVAQIRMISARRASRSEVRQFEVGDL